MSELIYSKSVPMAPFGKARPRVTRNGTYMPKDYITKKAELNIHCADRPDVRARAIGLQVVGIRPMPKGWSKKKRKEMDGQPTTAKPDIDNIIGAVMDALFVEDSNIVFVAASKRWGEEPEMIITMHDVGDGIPF